MQFAQPTCTSKCHGQISGLVFFSRHRVRKGKKLEGKSTSILTFARFGALSQPVTKNEHLNQLVLLRLPYRRLSRKRWRKDNGCHKLALQNGFPFGLSSRPLRQRPLVWQRILQNIESNCLASCKGAIN